MHRDFGLGQGKEAPPMSISLGEMARQRIGLYDFATWIIGWPKKADSLERVAIVKLCSPLSHLVISLGRRSSFSANCFLE